MNDELEREREKVMQVVREKGPYHVVSETRSWRMLNPSIKAGWTPKPPQFWVLSHRHRLI